MTKLIVNADDLGSGPGRDRGIFRAFEQGMVTSASLLANGPTFAEAARQSQTCGLPVGVHLNLSEGRTLTGEIPGITDAGGDLPGKARLRRILAEGSIDRQALRAELSAQTERVLDSGLHPDHLDTHQHCFLFPILTEMVLQIAAEHGISAMRLPFPAESPADDPPALKGELSLYRRLAPAAARAAESSNLFTPLGLFGMPALNRLDATVLAGILRSLPEGVWELMVHPGLVDPGHPFSEPEREVELAALTCPEIRAVVAELDIVLTTYGECTCVS